MKLSRLFFMLSVLFSGILFGQTYPKVVDSSTVKTGYYLSPKNMISAWYPIKAIDTISEEISPQSTTGYYGSMFASSKMLMYTLNHNLSVNQLGIELYVDTTQVLSASKHKIKSNQLIFESSSGKNKKTNTPIIEVNTYPVFLINNNDTLTVDVEVQDGSFQMICEVLDKNGEWKPIEYWTSSWCGNSYFTYNIPPKHVAYTLVNCYKGTISTSARLKLTTGFGIIYSNTFNISVNKGQFKNVTANKK